MNDFTKEITLDNPKCPKCKSAFSDISVVIWSNDNSKITEWRNVCSNKSCDYIMVTKNE